MDRIVTGPEGGPEAKKHLHFPDVFAILGRRKCLRPQGLQKMTAILEKPVLVSLCWYGTPCRYHGRPVASPAKIAALHRRYTLIPVCPELLGGLPVPRPGAPLRNKRNGCITDRTGEDLTASFRAGAQTTLEIAQEAGAERAYLVKGSPSCDRCGFTGELLLAHGIKVINW